MQVGVAPKTRQEARGRAYASEQAKKTNPLAPLKEFCRKKCGKPTGAGKKPLARSAIGSAGLAVG